MGVLARQSIGSAIYIALGFAIGSIANLFIFPYICPKEELGQYKLFFNWGMIFSQFIAVGAGTIAVKYLADFRIRKEESRLTFFTIYFPIFGILVFSVIFIPISVYFVHSITEKLYVDVFFAVFVIWAFTITQTFTKSFAGLSIALNRSTNSFFVSEFLTRLIVLGAFAIYYMGWVNYEGLLVLLILSYVIQLMLIIINVYDFLSQHGISRPGKKDIRQKFSFGLYSLLDSGANTIVTRLDVIMIGFLCVHANQNVQEYDMAINIATLVFLPWRSLNTTSGPFISEAFALGDMNRINELYKKISTNLILLGGVIFILIYTSMDDLIKVIPDDYSVVKYPVLFLGIAKLFDMASSVNNVILMISPYFRYNLVFNLFLIVLTITTNYFLIPAIGITGSAVATCITLVTFNLLKGTFLYRKYKLSPFSWGTLNSLIGLSVIFTAGFYFPSFFGNVFLDIGTRCAVIGILFFIYLIVFKPSEELNKIIRKFI